MPRVCLYLQLHQPFRLRDMSVFDLGSDRSYFSEAEPDGNRAIFEKVANKSYIPMLSLLVELVQTYPDFVFALSCSGIFLDQAQKFAPRVIELLQQLAATHQVEFLAETYYHSLASLYSPTEFTRQVILHQKKIQAMFGQTPTVFRNTELVYSNEIAQLVKKMGFTGMLTEAVDRYLHGRSRTQLYRAKGVALPLLLKHAQLSDDVAFRFSQTSWESYPLTAEKYCRWVEMNGEAEYVNLFMDFETFGEHQWESTGIFNFFRHFVAQFRTKPWNRFVTPTQAFRQAECDWLPIYDVPKPISWADIDRDLTAWNDNPLQKDCLRIMYELEPLVLRRADPELLETWRLLQTSDHFYYMCTKWSADGDVHAYFSPYNSPYEAYRRFAIVLADFQQRVQL